MFDKELKRMVGTIRFELPAKGTLKISLKLIIAVVLVGLIAQQIGGTTASLAVGLSAGAAMTFGTVMSTRASIVVTLILGLAAALGAAAYGQPIISGLVIALMVLLTGPASAYSAGILMLAPILTMLFTVTNRGYSWWEAGLWGIAGGLAGLGVAHLMKFSSQPPKPLPWNLAWRHAIVLAIASGLSILIAERLNIDHGYWVAVTLLVTLRPVPDERMNYVIQRIFGTLAGSAVALFTIILIPTEWLMVSAFVYLILLAAYAMSGNYFMQTLFLTPMLMIFLSSGADKLTTFDLTIERIFFTVVGVIIAAILAWGLAKWDKVPNKQSNTKK